MRRNRDVAAHPKYGFCATKAVFRVITTGMVIAFVAAFAVFVASQKQYAILGLVRIDAVVSVPVAHQIGIVTIPELVEICGIRFNASGPDNHIWIIL